MDKREHSSEIAWPVLVTAKPKYNQARIFNFNEFKKKKKTDNTRTCTTHIVIYDKGMTEFSFPGYFPIITHLWAIYSNCI